MISLIFHRPLDQIHAYGSTRLFTDLVTQMFTVYKEVLQLAHVDTTNFSVHGDYNSQSGDGCIKVTQGHAKDKRYDLKRFVLSLVVNQHGIPILHVLMMATNLTKIPFLRPFWL